jgi:hypothetical protein
MTPGEIWGVPRWWVPLPPQKIRKVFKVGSLSLDFGETLMEKSHFQRTVGAKYSKEETWRAWADPGGVFGDACPGIAPYVYYIGRVKLDSEILPL